jgi:hypothetical protein
MTTSAEVIGHEEVLDDPQGVAEHLLASGCIYGLVSIDVKLAETRMVVFWLTLQPWTPMAERGYPTERVSITVWANGRITAVPIAALGRTWEHRNPYVLGSMVDLGALCLWFPGDPRRLRWGWTDGFVVYITIVHRHLQAEEYFRREGAWPSEDTPHGPGNHPIRTLAMQQIAAQGAA